MMVPAWSYIEAMCQHLFSFLTVSAAMASSDFSPRTPPGLPEHPNRLPAELLIGALVPPMLLGVLISRGVTEMMTQVGLISEQLYQGERLPTLNVSTTETEAQ
jgi:hypothetical protein